VAKEPHKVLELGVERGEFVTRREQVVRGDAGRRSGRLVAEEGALRARPTER
jgi:hypothetical protein